LTLPYLEQQPLYDMYDFRMAAGTYERNIPPGMYVPGGAAWPANTDVVCTELDAFTCPSDTGPPTMTDESTTYYGVVNAKRGAKTNYDFSVCMYDAYRQNDWGHASGYTRMNHPTAYYVRRYMFGENSDTSVATVSDGTTNSAAVAETVHRVLDGAPVPWGYRGWVQVGADIGSRGINRWDVALGAWYGGDRTPYTGRLYGWGLAGSMHPGGCNITLGDGSVRFISETSDQLILRAIGSINQAEVVTIP